MRSCGRGDQEIDISPILLLIQKLDVQRLPHSVVVRRGCAVLLDDYTITSLRL
jgi:hypothetical protein